MGRVVLLLILVCVTIPLGAHAAPTTGGSADDLCAAAEFLGGSALSPDERRQLASDTSDRPAASELMRKIRHADGVTRAELRTKILIALYFRDPAHGASSLTNLVWAHDPVLMADTQSHLIVTRQALGDMVASDNFVAALAGQPRIGRELPLIAQQLTQQYGSLQAQQQHVLAFASRRWLALQQRWQQMTPVARAHVTQELHSTATTPQTIAVAARTLERVALEHHDAANHAANGSTTGLAQAMGAWFGMHTFLRGGSL